MSVEACWTVRFGDPRSPSVEMNGGIVVLESGRIFGGDSGFAYLGTYSVTDAVVEGSFEAIQHDAQVGSIYGDGVARFRANFTVSGDERMKSGEIKRDGYPSARLVLKRFAELP